MLRLAVATKEETFERMREPLADRGIGVEHVRSRERALPVTEAFDASAGAEAFDAGFVYPTRLMEGGVVDVHLGVPWVNDREAIVTSRNKAGVLAALSAADVPVPETAMVSNPADAGALADAAGGFDYPVVVKPNSAMRGAGVVRVTDPDTLRGVTDYFDLIHGFPATGDKSFLVQEFLPDARDYRAMVIDGTCVGGVERRARDGRGGGADGNGPEDGGSESGPRRWKHNVHRGAAAAGIDLPAEHRRLAERTAAVLDVPYLGVDLLETPDRLVVNETNARPTIDDAEKYDDGFYDRLAGLIRATARERE